MTKVKILKFFKIIQNWCLWQGSPPPCSCYKPAAGATLQGLFRKGYADDDADDDKDDDDDGDDMMLLIYSLKVVGAQRGSVLNVYGIASYRVVLVSYSYRIRIRVVSRTSVSYCIVSYRYRYRIVSVS